MNLILKNLVFAFLEIAAQNSFAQDVDVTENRKITIEVKKGEKSVTKTFGSFEELKENKDLKEFNLEDIFVFEDNKILLKKFDIYKIFSFHRLQ